MWRPPPHSWAQPPYDEGHHLLWTSGLVCATHLERRASTPVHINCVASTQTLVSTDIISVTHKDVSDVVRGKGISSLLCAEINTELWKQAFLPYGSPQKTNEEAVRGCDWDRGIEDPQEEDHRQKRHACSQRAGEEAAVLQRRGSQLWDLVPLRTEVTSACPHPTCPILCHTTSLSSAPVLALEPWWVSQFGN